MLQKYLNFTNNQIKVALFVSLFMIRSLSVHGYTEAVYSGIKRIDISAKCFLEIKSYYKKGCNREEDLCLPSNTLILSMNGKKYNFSRFISKWNDDTFVYFVKISPKGYFDDINKDGYFEIALYPMSAGTNPITAAYIYSIVGNNLVPYGKGRFHYERGPYAYNIVKNGSRHLLGGYGFSEVSNEKSTP